MALNIQNGHKAWIDQASRKWSREVDFGICWRQPIGGQDYPLWRVNWIKATGEVYAVQAGTDKFVVLGIEKREGALETFLDGWAEACLSGEGLNWIVERLK